MMMSYLTAKASTGLHAEGQLNDNEFLNIQGEQWCTEQRPSKLC